MAHGGMTKEAGKAYIEQLGSYVKPVTREAINALHEETGEGKMACRSILQKKAMLAAIEECRWEAGPTCNSAMHTVLDVLQYLVERT